MGYECGGYVVRDESQWDTLRTVFPSYRIYRLRGERVWVIDTPGPTEYPFSRLIGRRIGPELVERAKPFARVAEILAKDECDITDGGAATALRIASVLGVPVLGFEANDENVNAASVCDPSGVRRIRAQAEYLEVLFDGTSVQITPLVPAELDLEPDWPEQWRQLRRSLELIPAVTVTEPRPYNLLMHGIPIAEVGAFLKREGPFLQLGGDADDLGVDLVFEWNWPEQRKKPPAASQVHLRALLPLATQPERTGTPSTGVDIDFAVAIQAYDLALQGIEEQIAKGFIYPACRNMGNAADALADAGAALWKSKGESPRPWLEEAFQLLERIQEHSAAFVFNNRIFIAPYYARARVWSFLLGRLVPAAWIDAATFPMRHLAELQPRWLADAAESLTAELVCRSTLPEGWAQFNAAVRDAKETISFTAAEKRGLLDRLTHFQEFLDAVADADWRRLAAVIGSIATHRDVPQRPPSISRSYTVAALIIQAERCHPGQSFPGLASLPRWRW